MGGDQTINPTLSLNMPPTHPQNNPISFFTGVDNYQLTRSMGFWLNNTNVRVAGKIYETTTTVVDDYFNPWATNVTIVGTDGMQFSPELSEDSKISVFVNDLSRTCNFTYSSKNEDYKELETQMFMIAPDMMLNGTANPTNAAFDVLVDGTSNLTSTLRAPAFASKGHFY